MSTRIRRARSSRAFIPLTLSLLGVSVGLVAGCGGASTGGIGGGTPPAGPAADLPPLVVTMCLDRTPSFDRALFNDAKNLLADAILARASRGGQLGATIYVTLIGRNSYDTSATVRTIVVPAVPSAPASGATTPDNNVFTQKAATQTAAAAAGRADATAQALASGAAKLVQPDVAFLRALNPTTDSPTDILGCVSRAADRFRRADPKAQKLLIMATDLHQEGIQQTAKDRSLPGVDVKVIEWACQDAADCDARKAFWKDELVTKDKAAAFTTYDPAETQAQVASHLFSYDA